MGGQLGSLAQHHTVATIFIDDALQLFSHQVQGFIPADFPQNTIFSQQRVGESFMGMDKFMKMPAFGTEVPAAYGMVFAGIGANNFSLLNAQIHTTAASAVVAYCHDILHESLFSLEVIKIFLSTLFRVKENELKSQETDGKGVLKSSSSWKKKKSLPLKD